MTPTNQRRGTQKAGLFGGYRPRTIEDAKKRQNQNSDRFDQLMENNLPLFKPVDGANRVRILPPTWDGADHYGLNVFIHYNVGPEKQRYLCLDKMKGERCPVCVEQMVEKNRPDKDDAVVRALSALKRVAAWVIDRKHEIDGPQLWLMPKKMDDALTKQSYDDSTGELLRVEDPEEGFDILFTKEGQGINTDYIGTTIARRTSVLSEDADVLQTWSEFLEAKPIPSLLRFYSFDRIYSQLTGQSEMPPSHEEDMTLEDRSTPTPNAGEEDLEDESPAPAKSQTDIRARMRGLGQRKTGQAS
jgi:hypothetical protein